MYFKKVIVYKDNHFLGIKEIFENLDFYYYSARAKTNMTYYYINLNNIKKCFSDFPKFKEFFYKHNKIVLNYLNKLEKYNTSNYGEIINRKKSLNVKNHKKGTLNIQKKYSNKFLWNMNDKKKKNFQFSKFNKNFQIRDLKILQKDKKTVKVMNFTINKKKLKIKTLSIKENIFKNYKKQNYMSTFSQSLAQKMNTNLFNKIKEKKKFSIKSNRNVQINLLRSTSTKNFPYRTNFFN